MIQFYPTLEGRFTPLDDVRVLVPVELQGIQRGDRVLPAFGADEIWTVDACDPAPTRGGCLVRPGTRIPERLPANAAAATFDEAVFHDQVYLSSG